MALPAASSKDGLNRGNQFNGVFLGKQFSRFDQFFMDDCYGLVCDLGGCFRWLGIATAD